jgi:hypothetical protein
VIVFENECNPTFTFQIDGPDVTYVGRGDLHNPKYDHLEVSSWLNDLSDFSTGGRKYTGVPLDTDFCPFFLRVFPSQDMEDDYTTNDAVIFTVAAVAIFVFTSFMFLLYDYLVERRQSKVMKTAVQTSAIVSALFPSNVRDRLFPTEEETPMRHARYLHLNRNRKSTESFLRDGSPSDNMENVADTSRASRPIADLFPEATVMFADIAGFTAWSSTREPSQVFILLETIYGAFDKIADRRGVFKVETIGDSYVAVVGLPEPRPNHAIVMAKFARDCRERFDLITRELEKTLGPDTGKCMDMVDTMQ